MTDGIDTADTYRFRRVTAADLPLMAAWRNRPHVLEWWGALTVERDDEKLADPRIGVWIVELADRPFAFVQDYDVHGWEPHPFSHLPPGSRGIDLYIGEEDMLDQGHGTAFVREFLRRLFREGVPAVGTDPNPRNMRARRTFAKAGFREVSGPVITRWGEAILMECWPLNTFSRAELR
jgi:aminoglycoside 6'-N-acetyltransferase